MHSHPFFIHSLIHSFKLPPPLPQHAFLSIIFSRPMKSHDRDIVIRPSLQRPERSHDDRVSQDSLLSSSPRSVDSLSSKQPRGLKQKENPGMHNYFKAVADFL